MEASYILRCKIASPELLEFMQVMFSEDAPIFEEDVDKVFRPTFNALEECHVPEQVDKISETQLEIAWLTGSDMYEDLQDTVKRLKNAGADAVVGYYWMDEAETFFVCEGAKFNKVKGWKKRFKDMMNDGSDEEITACLSIVMQDFMDA